MYFEIEYNMYFKKNTYLNLLLGGQLHMNVTKFRFH